MNCTNFWPSIRSYEVHSIPNVNPDTRLYTGIKQAGSVLEVDGFQQISAAVQILAPSVSAVGSIDLAWQDMWHPALMVHNQNN